jgi:porin
MRSISISPSHKGVIAHFVVALFSASTPANAQPYAVPPTWGGNFWSRPRLTGDCGGLRDERGKKGVVLDVDVLTTPMDVLSGGQRRALQYRRVGAVMGS